MLLQAGLCLLTVLLQVGGEKRDSLRRADGVRMYVKLYGEIIMSELLKGTTLSLSNDPLMQLVPERVTTDQLLKQLSLWYVHPNGSLLILALLSFVAYVCSRSAVTETDFVVRIQTLASCPGQLLLK